MNKTTDKTKTPQQTKTGEQASEAAPAPTETETQLTRSEEPTIESPPVATDSPKEREYTRNIEETNLSLLIHSPRLFSELAHYFKAGLFAEKPTAQLWNLMSRGHVGTVGR